MLENVAKLDLLRRVVGERPRKLLQVHHGVGRTGGRVIHVHPALHLLQPASEVQPHRSFHILADNAQTS